MINNFYSCQRRAIKAVKQDTGETHEAKRNKFRGLRCPRWA